MSNPRSTKAIATVTLVSILVLGCRSHNVNEPSFVSEPPRARTIETPDVDIVPAEEATQVTEPLTINQQQEPQDWSLSLEDVVQITLKNSDVIRDLGGRVVAGPQGVSTIYDPAIQEIDPQSGVEAALSAFDAQLASNLFFNRTATSNISINTDALGNPVTNVATNEGQNNQFDFQVSKQSAIGTRFAMRNVTIRSDGVTNVETASQLFSSIFSSTRPSQYNTAFEAEIRQPLLQGAGLQFNRIAGPNARPGSYNGVLLARIRTDIALADFEASVRDLLRDVESAYWQLYYAYRTFDAANAAFEASLASWRIVQQRLEAGTADGEQEALARANFYTIKAAMQNALSGGTSTNQRVGVYGAERDLRKLMGIPANDGRLIRPSDEPTVAEHVIDWQESLEMALTRRVELRRQRWTIKQRENELLASKNFLLSQIDLVGLYRFRGVGFDLLGNDDVANGSAFSDLWTGDLQGWQMGVQYSANLGKRREHAAVRTAELRLAREKAVLRNQELIISNDLSGQFAELDRAYAVSRSNFNRAIAERQRLDAAMAQYDAGVELLEFVLQAQQNTAEADSLYYQALVDYNMAVANIHFARGSYLDYAGVQLTEGPWLTDAYRSYQKEFRRFKPRMNYCLMTPSPVSRGPYNQAAPRQEPTVTLLEDVPVEGEYPPEATLIPPAEIPADYSSSATYWDRIGESSR